MSLYQLPSINFKKIRGPEMKRLLPGKRMPFPGLFLILMFLIGLIGGLFSSYIFYLKLKQEIISAGVPIVHSEKVIEKEYVPQTTQEQKIIDVVKQNSPSVVSVVISEEVPVYEQQNYDVFGNGMFIVPRQVQTGTEKQQTGAGTGFIVSEDGLILTNKHVVSDDKAEYTVSMSDGKEYPATILAKDPVQDLAIMKINNDANIKFTPLKLGSSDDIQIGQSVIAIGNALGEFQNTVSVGVISGLGRTVVASGEAIGTETLEDIIQTDAAINKGNSGGPLLNLKGEVIGINTAVSSSGQNISFAISIDKAKKDIEQVKASGRITYPYMGVRYVVLNKETAQSKNLTIDYGALLVKGTDGPAVTVGSPAEKAGLKDGDVILEMGGEKITESNTLSKIISKYNPNDSVDLKIIRDGKEMTLTIVLGEWKQ